MKVLVTKGQYLWYKKFLLPQERFYGKAGGRLFLRFRDNVLIPESNKFLGYDKDITDLGCDMTKWRKVLPLTKETQVLYVR